MANDKNEESIFCLKFLEDDIILYVILQYLLLYISENCDPVNKVYFCDMSAFHDGLEGFKGGNALLPFIKLIDDFDAQYQEIANDDTVFTFLTNKDAPGYKVVRVDLKEPSSWNDVVPESEKDVLESAFAVNGDKMIVCYLSDVKYVIQIRDLKTGSLLHQLPTDIGSVTGISARRRDSTVFIGFTSFLTPGIIYQCNLDSKVPDMKIFREISVPGFNRSEFQVNQVAIFSVCLLLALNGVLVSPLDQFKVFCRNSLFLFAGFPVGQRNNLNS